MARKRNLRVVLEYDGTDFYGWQIQKDTRTVQGELQKAVEKVGGRKPTIIGAGRTDSGVHAEGQVANFHTTSAIPAHKWPRALNAILPEDATVLTVENVPIDFHAQFAATSKIYRYRVLNQSERSSLLRHRAHLVRPTLDIPAMIEGARALVGTHDFRSFGTEMARKEKTTRTILSFEITSTPPAVEFRVHGNGFLYNQVRSMVGTLLDVGLGKRKPGNIKEVIEARDRKCAGANVPAKGLTLVEVRYEGTPTDPRKE